MISRECINLVQQLFPSGKLHPSLGRGCPLLAAASTPLRGWQRQGASQLPQRVSCSTTISQKHPALRPGWNLHLPRISHFHPRSSHLDYFMLILRVEIAWAWRVVSVLPSEMAEKDLQFCTKMKVSLQFEKFHSSLVTMIKIRLNPNLHISRWVTR